MVDTTVCNWDFYKIPTIEILQYRSAFYRLSRRHDQSIEQWLKRVRELIDFCKFPLFFKYLLMDRFICGLNIVELEMIRSAGKFSTLEELLEILSRQKEQPNVNSKIDSNVNESKNKDGSTLDLIEKECLQNDHSIEIYDEDENYLIEVIPVEADEDEDDPPEETAAASDADESSDLPVPDEDEINYEMLNDAMQFECEDYKCPVDDAVASAVPTSTADTASGDENEDENLLDHSFEGEDTESNAEQSDPKIEKSDEKRFACDRCDKAFVHSSSLAKHKRIIHQGIRPYACDQCDKRCISAIDLKRHIVSHTEEREFACDQCDKSFKHASYLDGHKKHVHEGIQKIPRYACKICNKRFFSSTYLKQHLHTHTGERPYVCDQCDRTFTQTAALSRHIKIVHQEIRPYSCHLCLMSFKMSKNLKSHLTTHKQADQQTTSRKE